MLHVQGITAESSPKIGDKPSKTARHRHALFDDFNLTEPFGAINAAAGFISLFFKVYGCKSNAVSSHPLSCVSEVPRNTQCSCLEAQIITFASEQFCVVMLFSVLCTN